MAGDTTQAPGPIREGFEEIYTRSLDCVHCGLCLPVCPTYLTLGDEADSPRGRIYLMRAHDEGRQPMTPGLLQHLDRCHSRHESVLRRGR